MTYDKEVIKVVENNRVITRVVRSRAISIFYFQLRIR